MAITIMPTPVTLTWGNFTEVDSLANGEDAHIQFSFNMPNKPFRKVGSVWMLAESITVTLGPNAKVLKTATKTDKLLAHEQGHYDIWILVWKALAKELEKLSNASGSALGTEATKLINLHKDTRNKALQDLYDTDTNHSLNANQQSSWETDIKNCMTGSCTKLKNLDL